ncbi:ScyD/ScyE family protein [Lapillicoccus jejuensis]|uniref:ScyD/ScyE family protein n=1 Tax=Lapillicoccus jejuensis TaxID=402171 RepID=A0A542DXM3_9MICO|nr:ScyD/ScyE family protein [Lapillicoccus jejuensis]TQJ07842.1 hypothetical protein FB458_0913 [Lapillicoccus jejuensis]
MLRRARSIVVAVASGALALTLAPLTTTSAAASTATATGSTSREVLARDVVGPFNLAVRGDAVLVADGFTGLVSRVTDGHSVPVVTNAPGAAGVEWSTDGSSFAYTTTDDSGNAAFVLHRPGADDLVVDLSGYERMHNPDSVNTYGVLPSANACAKAFFRQVTQGPARYTGLLDAHPYSVAALADGTWAVADAGGNDILRITTDGTVSTMAVLPPQPITITAEQAAALGAPTCIVGTTYRFEPVPTDVEQAPDGRLWVTTLPGGPEGPELGARGSLYRLDASGGSAFKVATGFLGATNLAVGSGRDAKAVFVAELFGGRIAKVQDGRVTTFAQVAGPLGVEVAGGSVYVSTIAQTDDTGAPVGPGKVLRYQR